MTITNNSKLDKLISIGLTSAIGVVFLVSGISKLLVVNSFQMTITKFLPFLFTYSSVIAYLVIILELVLGLLLFFRYKLLATSAALSVLLTFFIGILMYESMTGNSIRCNCFGGFNLSFPAKIQILIDFLLINGLLIVGYLEKDVSHINKKYGWHNWVIPILFLLLVEAAVSKTVWFERPINNTKDISELKRVIAKRKMPFVSNGSTRSVIFLISFYDFNCPLCYDDFVSISDSLQKQEKNKTNILYLFEKESATSESLDSTRLEAWKVVNRINSPVYLVKNDLFRHLFIRKSSVIVLDSNEELFTKREFPIGIDGRKEILAYLSN